LRVVLVTAKGPVAKELIAEAIEDGGRVAGDEGHERDRCDLGGGVGTPERWEHVMELKIRPFKGQGNI
jgi:hypothetical protein